jgi:PIN domain nuclease of toxin-antitoxin system
MGRTVKIVLDTCALIWWSLDPNRLSPPAKEICTEMEKQKNGFVPSIAIWEIGKLRLYFLASASYFLSNLNLAFCRNE